MKTCSNCRDLIDGTCNGPTAAARGRAVAATDGCTDFAPKSANDDKPLGRTG